MGLLLRRAEAIGREGEVPVSALVLDSQARCIGFGGNTREMDQDPLGHAELVAIRQATRLRGDWRLNDCTLMVTLEPCPMCAGAIVHARVARVVYGARDERWGAVESVFAILGDPRLNHRVDWEGGLLAEESRRRLKAFFAARR